MSTLLTTLNPIVHHNIKKNLLINILKGCDSFWSEKMSNLLILDFHSINLSEIYLSKNKFNKVWNQQWKIVFLWKLLTIQSDHVIRELNHFSYNVGTSTNNKFSLHLKAFHLSKYFNTSLTSQSLLKQISFSF